jgi:hypothetical protein
LLPRAVCVDATSAFEDAADAEGRAAFRSAREMQSFALCCGLAPSSR